MNSFVKIEDTVSEDYGSYSVIVLESIDLKEIFHWNDISKTHKTPLFVLMPCGLNAFIFAYSPEDITFEEYLNKLKDLPKVNELSNRKKKMWTQSLLHTFICGFLNLDNKEYFEKNNADFFFEKTLESFEEDVKMIGVEFNPVVSVIGALVAHQINQYVIQAKGYEKMKSLVTYDSSKELTTNFSLDLL